MTPKTMTRQRTHPELKPAIRPSNDDVMKACHLLGDLRLAVYQRLYKAGLTAPGHPASPFETRIHPDHMACVEILNHVNPKFNFKLGPHDDIEKVVEKCERIFEAINAGRTSHFNSKACGAPDMDANGTDAYGYLGGYEGGGNGGNETTGAPATSGSEPGAGGGGGHKGKHPLTSEREPGDGPAGFVKITFYIP